MFGWIGLSALVLAGCFPGPAAPKPPKSRAGITLRVAAPDVDAVRQLLRRHGNGWTDLSGATVDVIGASAEADVVVFAPADLPGLISGGRIGLLPPAFSEHGGAMDLGFFLRPYRVRLMDWQAKKYAVPIMGDSLLFAWRADLLDNPKHQKEIENRLKHPLLPSGPTTWQEVEVLAKYFHEIGQWTPGDGGKAGRPSLPPLPDSPEALDRVFHSVAAPFALRGVSEELLNGLSADERHTLLYDYQFDIDTGEARIAGPGFVEALALLKRMQPYRATGRSPHPARALAAGTAVAGLVTLADVPALRKFEEGAKDVRFGISAVPGSTTCFTLNKPVKVPSGNFVPYLGSGGWMAAVAPGARAADAATEFLAHLASPAVSLEIVYEPTWGAGPTRTTHLELNNRSGWYNYGLSVERTNSLVAALEKSVNPPPVNPAFRLRISDQQKYLQAEVEALGAALDGQTEPAAALADLAKRWNDLGGAAGKEKRMREYRQSLGLN